MKANPEHSYEAGLEAIGTLKLPTLSAGTPFLLKSLTDENIDFVELATILEKFPSIAGKLISLANSAWSAPVAPVSSLEASCSRLGFGIVRSISIALAVAAPFDASRCPCFDPEYFWCSALLSAEASSRVAQLVTADNAVEPSTARAAGLLHDLGLLWLVDQLPAEAGKALTMVRSKRAASLQQAMHHILGFDQVEAGGHLARQWNLPGPLVAAMTHYPELDFDGDQNQIVAIVGLAVKLVSAVLREEPLVELDHLQLRLGITDENFEGISEQLSAQLLKTRQIAKLLIG